MREKNITRRTCISMSMALVPALMFSSVLAASPVAALADDLPVQAAEGANIGARKIISASSPISGGVSPITKFDCANTGLTAGQLAEAGFKLGDSVDVRFSNGYALTDVPYFSGYYVKKGMPLVVAYPGNDFVQVGRNNADFWTPAGLSEGDTVTISLNTEGKYLATQQTLNQSYSDDPSKYGSDTEFANFRALTGGKLKKDFLYRGASPVDNRHNRAAIVDGLLRQTGIAAIVDLADSEEDMASYLASVDFASAYAKSLYEQGRTALLAMGSNYDSDSYKAGVAKAAHHIIAADGPVYIHCMEGKDRTGFVCLLLEALGGASVDEMRADYMQTYANYYKITEADRPENYAAVKGLYFDEFLESLSGEAGEARDGADYVEAARNYLASCGLSDTEIDALAATICA